MIYTILILGGFDNLFNVLFFLVGILFTLSVTRHHQISLTVCLQFPAVLTHTRSSLPTPGRPYPHPAVISNPRPLFPIPCRPLQSPSSLLTHSWPSFQLPAVCVPPPPSLLSPYRLLMPPIVRTIPAVLLSPLPSA